MNFDESDRTGGGGRPPETAPGDERFDPRRPDQAPPANQASPGDQASPGNVADPAVGRPVDAAAVAAADQATIMGGAQQITLVNGMKVNVKPLRTRELLAVLDIGTAGLGPRLADLRLDPDEPTEVFVAKFAGLIISGLGSARDEVMAFLRMVCEPAGKVTTFRPDKAQRARNAALDEALDAELDNPDPDDTISIIEAVVAGNAADLQAWGKRLAGIVKLARRTGQIPASPTSAASN